MSADNDPERRPADRGFALLLVLWALVLLTLIVSSLVAGGRGEVRLSANLRAAAVAEALADGAVHEAVFRLLDATASGWQADGTARELALPDGRVTLRIEDQAGLVNPNVVADALMVALLRRLGADSRQAASVAAAIADWRFPSARPRPLGGKAPQYQQAGLDYAPPEAPFRSVDEVALVLGMTPALFDRLKPHLTVFWQGDPEPALAAPLVRQAIMDATGATEFGPANRAGVRVFAITASALGHGGGRFTRRAVVRVGSALAGRPYRILAWERTQG